VNAADPRRVEEVFDGALERSGVERARFLDAECEGDPTLRTEVEALLLRDADPNEDAGPARSKRADPNEDAGPARSQRADPNEDARPGTVGRFEVVRKIGQGGMGIVYEAYDGTLDRRVALKLVRFADADDGGRVARTRLLREAQAMAQVADPHVVPVYEVGEHGDEVFIAMELVEGETLSAWLGRAPRTWREALAMYVASGRGLAAAHARGIVHRDFKPDNVLVGRDGRPRVLDFGLALMRREEAARPGADDAPAHGLTATGALMGTPQYMSPEHFRAQNVDAQSDQFCFGVALYRALFGVFPFEGTTLIVLGDRVCSGDVRPPPASEVPPAVVHAVIRALSPDPDARFPSMPALLDELEKPLRVDPELDPARGRRGRRVAVAVMAALACVLLVAITSLGPIVLTPRAIVLHGSVGFVAMCVLGVVFRKAFRASAHNRRVGAVLPRLHARPGGLRHRSARRAAGRSVRGGLPAQGPAGRRPVAPLGLLRRHQRNPHPPRTRRRALLAARSGRDVPPRARARRQGAGRPLGPLGLLAGGTPADRRRPPRPRRRAGVGAVLRLGQPTSSRRSD
jgi:serine/threonine-protein kinase